MRNLFDQFQQPENRLTHALMCSLHEDPRMLKRFVRWATGERAPTGNLRVAEQSLPGQDEGEELTEQQRRGLPDGWIYDDDGWALLIESKIECRLEADQIQRHRFTARRRGFTQLHTVALVTELPERVIDSELKIRRWTELYIWLKAESRNSEWARRLHEYMDILEAKLVADEYLKTGTLTLFTGVPFGTESPYNYLEAKRVLRLAMDELRLRDDLHLAFGIDRNTSGRAAITGKDSGSVWDYLRLAKSAEAKTFTEFPHLTLGLHREYMHAIVIVPNGLRSDFRKNLLGQGLNSFVQIFSEILTKFNEAFGNVAGAVPWVELIQRRYPSQRSEPFTDALLEFDLRTSFPATNGTERSPKLQTKWLQATYEALSDRNGNLQLATGVRFSYDRCPHANTRAILDHIAHAWVACTPLIKNLLG